LEQSQGDRAAEVKPKLMPGRDIEKVSRDFH
jgi:hypothetical protein